MYLMQLTLNTIANTTQTICIKLINPSSEQHVCHIQLIWIADAMSDSSQIDLNKRVGRPV